MYFVVKLVLILYSPEYPAEADISSPLAAYSEEKDRRLSRVSNVSEIRDTV